MKHIMTLDFQDAIPMRDEIGRAGYCDDHDEVAAAREMFYNEIECVTDLEMDEIDRQVDLLTLAIGDDVDMLDLAYDDPEDDLAYDADVPVAREMVYI